MLSIVVELNTACIRYTAIMYAVYHRSFIFKRPHNTIYVNANMYDNKYAQKNKERERKKNCK